MGTDVEGRVVEDLLLHQLLLLFLAELPLEEVEGWVGLLQLDWPLLPFLLLEDGAQIAILAVVLAAVHLLLLCYYCDKLVMSFIEGVTSFIRYQCPYPSSLLTFYIPIFFTFRYLMLNHSDRVRAILKFWCILTFYFFVHYVLQFALKGYSLSHLALSL